MDMLTILLLLAFAIRVYTTFCCNDFSPTSFTSDENGHLAHERLLAQGANLKTYLTDHLYNRTTIGYPNLFHHMARLLFKEDYSLVKRRYLSGFFSMLFPILFFLLGINFYSYDVVAFTTIALLLSLATFGLFVRQYKAYTGRSLADFILMSGYLFVVLYYQTQDIAFYILAVFSFSLVWFSSEFGMQSIMLTPILWAILSGSTLPLEISILSIILALIFSKQKILDNLNHKFFHWIWYFRNQSFLHEKKDIKVRK